MSGILVLCRNEDHCRKVKAALDLPGARYVPWHSLLMGSRFSKVIWLAGPADGEAEAQEKEQVLRERVPTLLEFGGKLFAL